MRYRKLDADGDYSFGRGQNNFYRDVPEAPAQAVLTRLMLFSGEWFLNSSEGTPYSTKVLGKNTVSTRDSVLRARILDTTAVTSILAYYSTWDPTSRSFVVQTEIDTAYGSTTVTGIL